MTAKDHDRAAADSPDDEVGRGGRVERARNHDLSNLLLAARLHLDALRAKADASALAAQLDAIDSCLEQANRILKSGDAE